jgi:hypothetical protein
MPRLRTLALGLLILPLLLNAQRRPSYPSPPGSMDHVSQSSPATVFQPRVDSVQLDRQAKELADLAGSIPADIDHVNHGLLPKDTSEKLKRIEKLAKQLRGQVSQ